MKKPPTKIIRTLVLLTAVLTGCAAGEQAPGVNGTGDAAREMARLSTETGSRARALDRGADAALESSVEALELRLGRDLSDDEEQRVRAILRSALADIVTADLWERTLSEVYAAQFSEAEISTALEFYRSPLGRKILERDAAMAEQMEQRIVAAFETRLDEFSQHVDAALAEAFPAASGEGPQ